MVSAVAAAQDYATKCQAHVARTGGGVAAERAFAALVRSGEVVVSDTVESETSPDTADTAAAMPGTDSSEGGLSDIQGTRVHLDTNDAEASYEYDDEDEEIPEEIEVATTDEEDFDFAGAAAAAAAADDDDDDLQGDESDTDSAGGASGREHAASAKNGTTDSGLRVCEDGANDDSRSSRSGAVVLATRHGGGGLLSRSARSGLSDDDLVLFDESMALSDDDAASGSPSATAVDGLARDSAANPDLSASSAARALVNQLSQALAMAAQRANAAAAAAANAAAAAAPAVDDPPPGCSANTAAVAVDDHTTHIPQGRESQFRVEDEDASNGNNASLSSTASSIDFPSVSYADMQREVDEIAQHIDAAEFPFSDDDGAPESLDAGRVQQVQQEQQRKPQQAPSTATAASGHSRRRRVIEDSSSLSSSLSASLAEDYSDLSLGDGGRGDSGGRGGGDRSSGKSEFVHYTAVSGLRRTVSLGRFLGRGSFGDVRLGTVVDTGEMVAVKRLCAIGSSSGVAGKSMETLLGIEVSLLRQFNHPCVVSYRGLAADAVNGDFNIVLEYVGGGSLQAAIDARGGKPFSDDDAASIVRDVLDGLVYLHGMGVIHRDLKPANVLLRGEGGVPGGGEVGGALRAVLTDFGVSTQLAQLHSIRRSCVGTPGYAAPEVLDPERDYNRLCDIYSLGSLTYAVITGRRPWFGCDPVGAMLKTVRGELPPFPKRGTSVLGHAPCFFFFFFFFSFFFSQKISPPPPIAL
jgi:hypothetical protein